MQRSQLQQENPETQTGTTASDQACSDQTCQVCSGSEWLAFGSKSGYAMIRCAHCGLVRVNPMPGDEELSDFYQNYHKTGRYNAKLDSKVRRARRRIKRVGGAGRGRSFVDIGCNAGFAVAAAKDLGYEALGIDIDVDSVALASRNFPGARFEATAVEQLAMRGETFDLLYCSEVIEHLPSLFGFVASLKKLMHTDSQLFLTTPDLGHFTLSPPFSRQPLLDWDAIRPPEHLFYFSTKNLELLFRNHGFSRVRCVWNNKPTIKAIIQL